MQNYRWFDILNTAIATTSAFLILHSALKTAPCAALNSYLLFLISYLNLFISTHTSAGVTPGTRDA